MTKDSKALSQQPNQSSGAAGKKMIDPNSDPRVPYSFEGWSGLSDKEQEAARAASQNSALYGVVRGFGPKNINDGVEFAKEIANNVTNAVRGLASHLDPTRSNFEKGLELYKSGKIEESVSYFRSAVKENPNNKEHREQFISSLEELAKSKNKYVLGESEEVFLQRLDEIEELLYEAEEHFREGFKRGGGEYVKAYYDRKRDEVLVDGKPYTGYVEAVDDDGKVIFVGESANGLVFNGRVLEYVTDKFSTIFSSKGLFDSGGLVYGVVRNFENNQTIRGCFGEEGEEGMVSVTHYDGSKLIGEWRNGKPWNVVGKRVVYETKRYKEGVFVDGQLDGLGIDSTKGDDVFIGNFKGGSLEGFGMVFYPRQEGQPWRMKYRGFFEKYYTNGIGTFFRWDGSVLRHGGFKNGNDDGTPPIKKGDKLDRHIELLDKEERRLLPLIAKLNKQYEAERAKLDEDERDSYGRAKAAGATLLSLVGGFVGFNFLKKSQQSSNRKKELNNVIENAFKEELEKIEGSINETVGAVIVDTKSLEKKLKDLKALAKEGEIDGRLKRYISTKMEEDSKNKAQSKGKKTPAEKNQFYESEKRDFKFDDLVTEFLRKENRLASLKKSLDAKIAAVTLALQQEQKREKEQAPAAKGKSAVTTERAVSLKPDIDDQVQQVIQNLFAGSWIEYVLSDSKILKDNKNLYKEVISFRDGVGKLIADDIRSGVGLSADYSLRGKILTNDTHTIGAHLNPSSPNSLEWRLAQFLKGREQEKFNSSLATLSDREQEQREGISQEWLFSNSKLSRSAPEVPLAQVPAPAVVEVLVPAPAPAPAVEVSDSVPTPPEPAAKKAATTRTDFSTPLNNLNQVLAEISVRESESSSLQITAEQTWQLVFNLHRVCALAGEDNGAVSTFLKSKEVVDYLLKSALGVNENSESSNSVAKAICDIAGTLIRRLGESQQPTTRAVAASLASVNLRGLPKDRATLAYADEVKKLLGGHFNDKENRESQIKPLKPAQLNLLGLGLGHAIRGMERQVGVFEAEDGTNRFNRLWNRLLKTSSKRLNTSLDAITNIRNQITHDGKFDEKKLGDLRNSVKMFLSNVKLPTHLAVRDSTSTTSSALLDEGTQDLPHVPAPVPARSIVRTYAKAVGGASTPLPTPHEFAPLSGAKAPTTIVPLSGVWKGKQDKRQANTSDK